MGQKIGEMFDVFRTEAEVLVMYFLLHLRMIDEEVEHPLSCRSRCVGHGEENVPEHHKDLLQHCEYSVTTMRWNEVMSGRTSATKSNQEVQESSMKLRSSSEQLAWSSVMRPFSSSQKKRSATSLASASLVILPVLRSCLNSARCLWRENSTLDFCLKMAGYILTSAQIRNEFVV